MRELVHPPALAAGDTVAVISPAGPVTPALLKDGVDTLESWGLNVWLHDDVFARRERAGYLAGDDRVRLASLQEAFASPEVDAVLCSRGGYGAMRLLPDLDLEALRARPRLLVGFSDVTALHLYLAGVGGLATLHGPVVKSFHLHDDDSHDSVGELRRALFGERSRLEFSGLRPIRPGRARGPVLGGNLSLVASMVGSAHCPDLNGAILVLEDIGEEDYRLDRLFTTLRLSEKAAHPAGIVLGDFTGCAGAYVDEGAIDEFVAELAAEFGCPVVADFPAGHGRRNVAFPMGVDAELDAHAGVLLFEADAVG